MSYNHLDLQDKKSRNVSARSEMDFQDIEKKISPLGGAPLNIYVFSWEGLCMSEQQGAISHDSLVGLTIEELSLLRPNLLDRFRQAQKGEGVSWFSNTNHIRSVAGLIPIFQDRVIVGYSSPLAPDVERFLEQNGISHLPGNW